MTIYEKRHKNLENLRMAKIIIYNAILLIIFLFAGNIHADSHGSKKPVQQANIPQQQVEYSGFLGDYENFKVVNPQTQAELWIRPPHEDLSLLKNYHSIVFSPIEIWMDPETSYRGIDPNELKQITDYFLTRLEEELGKDYKIVQDSGPGVMNIRLAITGLNKEKPDYKKVYNLIPVKAVYELGHAAYRKVAGKQVDIYEATVEMEIRDSDKNIRLVAAVDRQATKATVEKGTGTDWDNLQGVLDYWVKTIKARLTAARKS